MAAPLAIGGAARRTVLALVASLVLTLAAVPVSDAAPAGAPPAPVPVLDWTGCGDGFEGFECATARVPLDHDRPDGPKISLALARLPAAGPGRKLGSIFLNPGGPGGSGVDMVLFAGPVLFSDEVRARFDLVGFDPRGVAGSTPLRCFDTFEEAIAVLAPMAFPVTRAEERVWLRSDRALAGACAERGGPILDHMATADVARDMDLLRRAVGDERLTYAGYSYGSFLGATYANLFPAKVRAVMVDGILDPVAWTTGRGAEAERVPFTTRLRSDQSSYATLGQFLTLCDRGGDTCAFSGGDPRRRYDRLARRLLDEPAQLPDGEGGTIPFTYADLVGVTLGALYDPGVWPDLAAFLQELDVLTSPARAAAAERRLRARLEALQQEAYPNFIESFPGVACSDSDNPDQASAWSRAAAAADRRAPYFGRLWTWGSSVCAVWPGRDRDRYTGPFTRRTANPVLVVGNRFDPATPYRGAVALDRLLPSSRLLTLDGWGHVALGLSACVDAHVNRYLLTTRVPRQGTVCAPDAVPFAGPVAQGRTSAAATGRASLMPPPLRVRLAR